MHTVINELSRTCFIFSINNSSSWSATFLPSKLPYALCPKGKIHTDVPTQHRTVRQAHPHPLPKSISFSHIKLLRIWLCFHPTAENISQPILDDNRLDSRLSLGFLTATGGLWAALRSILQSLSLLLNVYWSFTLLKPIMTNFRMVTNLTNVTNWNLTITLRCLFFFYTEEE